MELWIVPHHSHSKSQSLQSGIQGHPHQPLTCLPSLISQLFYVMLLPLWSTCYSLMINPLWSPTTFWFTPHLSTGNPLPLHLSTIKLSNASRPISNATSFLKIALPTPKMPTTPSSSKHHIQRVIHQTIIWVIIVVAEIVAHNKTS